MFGRNKTGIKVKNGKVVYNKRFNNLLDAMINHLLIEKNYKNLNKQSIITYSIMLACIRKI